MLSITFLYHSCFKVESDDAIFLFDCYKEDKIETDKDLYVLTSHFHKDHYNSSIFTLPAKTFYISSTVKKLPPQDNIVKVRENMVIEEKDFTLRTFASTDCGVCFLLCVGSTSLYFAGDNNAWLWSDEEDEVMMKRYRGVLKKIPSPVDVAFVPVDGRLGKHFADGALEVIRYLKPKTIFPMHFWMDFTLPGKLKTLFQEKRIECRIADIAKDAESFDAEGWKL